MSIRYNYNGNQFVHQIRHDRAIEVPTIWSRTTRIISAIVNFFKRLFNSLCCCFNFSERVITPVSPKKPEWSDRVMKDSINTRNNRLNHCHIPDIKGITQYFNSVRNSNGMLDGPIFSALNRLNPYITPIVSNNFLLVQRRYFQLAFEEAIVIQEALMFEGADAIPAFNLFLHPYDDEGNAYPAPSDDWEKYPYSAYRPDYCGIGQYSFILQDDPRYAGINDDYDDFHSSEESLFHYNDDYDDFHSSEESLFHDNTDMNDQPLFKENAIMEPESKMFSFGLLLATECRNECSICNELLTSTETSCCQVHICFNCFSRDIVTKTKEDLNHWINRNQMVECVNCRSPFQLGAHEQELSDAAKNILDYFNQQYIITLHSQYSNVLAVYCKDVNCKKTYLILEDSVYFQCNNITDHSDHRVKLHHVDCSFLWHFDHNCPASSKNKRNNAIATVKHLIHYVDSIRKCPGTAVKTCAYLIEKDEGCNHIICKMCSASYCWDCEQDWKTHDGEYYKCINKRETHEARKQRLSKLNQELEALLFPNNSEERW